MKVSAHLKIMALLVWAVSCVFVGCHTTAPPLDGGEMAGAEGGEAAGEIMAGESVAGEVIAGEVIAGENMAGETGGEDGGNVMAGEMVAGEVIAGEMDEGPNFDPTSPLPTPVATTQAPPAKIAEASGGSVDSTCEGKYASEVRGWVVDEVGEPMKGAKVQLCIREFESGLLICLRPVDSEEGGYYSIPVPATSRCMAEAAFRSIVPRVAFAPMYCHARFPSMREDDVLRVTEPLVLYQTRPALSVMTEGESNRQRVEFLESLTVSFSAEALYGPTVDELGVRALPTTSPGLCFLEDGEEAPQIDGLFAFAPEGDFDGENASIRLQNSAGYAPGSQVALYVLGNLDCSLVNSDEALEEASWTQQGVGVVDDSGMWIDAPPETGLPCLSWMGYGPLP